MFVWCQRVLHFAEGVAYKRIQAARAARRHPRLLGAVRSGELHLTAVSLLAPKLTQDNCAELIQATRHRSADEIRQLLADREPRRSRSCETSSPRACAAGSPPHSAACTLTHLPPSHRHHRLHRTGRSPKGDPNPWGVSATAFSSWPAAKRTHSSKSCAP
jgi:hypothetical protein